MKQLGETVMRGVFFLTACVSIAAVALICIFLFRSGLPAIAEISPLQFLTGTVWRPANNLYGIFPMIVGSIYVTAGALLIGVPVGLLTAVFLARFCPRGLYRVLHPAIGLLAGIQSVVYGFFGLVVLVPFVREQFGGRGLSVLTASVLLGIMILPTIVSVSESAIRALAVEPEVLLMDEPTSTLDPISTARIEDLSAELKKQYTIIMVTHNMQQAVRIADRTAFFLLGEVIEYGDTDQIFSMPKDKRTEDYITGRFG